LRTLRLRGTKRLTAKTRGTRREPRGGRSSQAFIIVISSLYYCHPEPKARDLACLLQAGWNINEACPRVVRCQIPRPLPGLGMTAECGKAQGRKMFRPYKNPILYVALSLSKGGESFIAGSCFPSTSLRTGSKQAQHDTFGVFLRLMQSSPRKGGGCRERLGRDIRVHPRKSAAKTVSRWDFPIEKFPAQSILWFSRIFSRVLVVDSPLTMGMSSTFAP